MPIPYLPKNNDIIWDEVHLDEPCILLPQKRCTSIQSPGFAWELVMSIQKGNKSPVSD